MPSSPRPYLTRLLVPLSFWLAGTVAVADEQLRILTAHTANATGLIDELVMLYQSSHPAVHIQVTNTGAMDALQRARAGEADAVITHAPDAELLFMADGFGVSRTLFMRNGFAIFGPPDDPLGLHTQTDLAEALRRIADAEPAFLVPSLRSGTTYRLSQLWAAARVRADWLGYESTGSGSRNTLATAATFSAYAFGDMGSYYALPANQRAALVPLVRDHRALRNDYSYLVVNPARVTGANTMAADDFRRFLISDEAQQHIARFGSKLAPAPLFTPAAYADPDVQGRRIREQIDNQRQTLLLLSLAVTAGLGLSLFGAFVYRRARRLANAALTETARLQRSLDNAGQGTFDWDIRAGTLTIDDRMRALLDIDKTDARNLHALLRQALDHNESSRASLALQQAISLDGEQMIRVTFRRRGEMLELRAGAEHDSRGTPTRLSGTLQALPESARDDERDTGLRDDLTGLPNRELLMDRLQHTLSQCARSHSSCMVLMVSIFAERSADSVTDAGPAEPTIAAVAARLRHLLRASDTIARIDTHAFAILLPASDEDHCRLAVEKLLAGLDRPFHIDHRSVHVEGAIGCAIYPDHGDLHHVLLQRAQLAMLQATRDGKRLVIFQTPTPVETTAPDDDAP